MLLPAWVCHEAEVSCGTTGAWLWFVPDVICAIAYCCVTTAGDTPPFYCKQRLIHM